MWSYLLRCRLQKRPHLLKKKSLPTLPNFFGVVTLNTHILLALLNTRNTLKKMAELTYAELTQGRESTRLPHTYTFTSLKNVVTSALHKIDKWIHIQAQMQWSKEEYARKRTHNGCLVQIESPVTQDVWHHSASFLMLNSYRRDRIFNTQLTAIKNSYNKVNV